MRLSFTANNELPFKTAHYQHYSYPAIQYRMKCNTGKQLQNPINTSITLIT